MIVNQVREVYNNVTFIFHWDIFNDLIENYKINVKNFTEANEKQGFEIGYIYYLQYSDMARLIYNEFSSVLFDGAVVEVNSDFFNKYFKNAYIGTDYSVCEDDGSIDIYPSLEYEEKYPQLLAESLNA